MPLSGRSLFVPGPRATLRNRPRAAWPIRNSKRRQTTVCRALLWLTRNGSKIRATPPAFSAGGQIYFRETMPEKNRGMYATHEITHVMKQVGYTPYLDFVSKTPDMLDMSTLEARILLEHTAKHRGIDPFNTSLSETDRLNLYDELNATVYGHISSGNMRGLNEVLNTAFYDFSAYTKELNELHERFKADNQKKAKEKTRYSLKNFSDAEQRDHRKKAIAFFGKTYNWNETGYLTPAGTKLDFSGRHKGGPGGYRTVDHRDIRDAIGEDYGGDDYSGSMVQFMSEGNIRISPESGGINLSVEPTKSQLDALSDFISKNRGEVILDLDTTDVVIDTRKNGSILLYDVLNLQPTSFAEKETDAAISTNSSPRTARSTASVSTYIL